MGREERPGVKEFLNLLADLLAEKYFERLDDRMKKIPELRRLITAKEASQYLSLSTDTIYRLASAKKLPYLKIGDRVLFDLKALDRWIEKHLIREKDYKKEELRAGAEPPNELRPSRESDLLNLLKKKGREPNPL
ncbi:MAG: helix-turn-helix domain-containing protein [Desulfobacterota bacterium]|nr:helix-turn-helix domain-containing protein [Thermodesulfobacteriota bacterium]